MRSDAKRLLEFLRSAGKLKLVPRSGWVQRGVKHAESVAEHSYRVALVAMLLCDLQKCSAEKVLKMALLHDLQEALVGDITKKSANYNEKKAVERRAIEKILHSLPGKLGKEYLKLWKEYADQKTKEARLVKQADKLELLLQVREYEKLGYALHDFWREKYHFDAKAKKLFEALKRC